MAGYRCIYALKRVYSIKNVSRGLKLKMYIKLLYVQVVVRHGHLDQQIHYWVWRRGKILRKIFGGKKRERNLGSEIHLLNRHDFFVIFNLLVHYFQLLLINSGVPANSEHSAKIEKSDMKL